MMQKQIHMAITTQVGVASFPDDGVTFQSLVEGAMIKGQPIATSTITGQSKPNLYNQLNIN